MTPRREPYFVFRIVLVLSGVAAVVVAIAADRLGLGLPGSFGLGQLLLALAGLCLSLVGWLWSKAVALHRGLAIVLLNTLILLGLLELASIAAVRSGIVGSPDQSRMSSYLDIPYYVSQDWSQLYWEEAVRAESYRYEPFVLWRHRSFEGGTISIGHDGVRRTPGSECTDDSYRVFTFGGSSMWGWGAPDWGTIAAHLRRGLQSRISSPVCVINFGEDAYVSTQELIALIRELEREHIPHAVLYYDGVNDVYAAYETSQAATHLSLANIAAKLEDRAYPLLRRAQGLRQVQLARQLVQRRSAERGKRAQNHEQEGDNAKITALASSVLDTYLNNYRMVKALAREYAFTFFIYWQPHLAVDGKRLTEEEQVIRSRLDPRLVRLAQQVYADVAAVAHQHENLWYIADAFDGVTGQIWIDGWGHVTPAGNELIAERMLTLMEERLESSRLVE